ncbi:Aste57867_22753 [Aphanomyces stellatus]|uniref:Aste57867_22753 protein n=1 Tax=Aphanomyces stellatus TaxID=120398 RepID=A0A485LM16_9STRA|nr:hypothetical protein As57867_022683 [Aphanomyces stellatus]VFT99406.1 Aste57867_22753 [Aphanomyces stellatus]
MADITSILPLSSVVPLPVPPLPVGRHASHQRRHKFQRRSLGCLSLSNPLRRICIRLVTWRWFDRFIVVAVLFNTIILGLTDYTNAWADGPNLTIPINRFIEKSNVVSFYIFLVEAAVKSIALGVCWGDGAYLSDGWNRLDFVIVVSGLISAFNIKGIKVGFIRVLRVLRPLRTLHSLPGLRVLTNALLASLPALANVFILLLFVMLVFAILGMESYRGDFHFRCRVTPFPVTLPSDGSQGWPPYVNASYIATVQTTPQNFTCVVAAYDDNDGDNPTLTDEWPTPQPCFWPLDASEPVPLLCNQQPDIGRQCRRGTVCGSNFDVDGHPKFSYLLTPPWSSSHANDDALFTPNLNYGLASFDNLGRTWVIILQTITASGWMVLLQSTQNTASPVVAAIYFHALLFIGMCFLLQLNMAVLFKEFQKAKEDQARHLDEQHAREASVLAALGVPTGQHKVLVSSMGSHLVKRIAVASPSTPPPGDVAINAHHGRSVQSWALGLIRAKHFTKIGLAVTVVNIVILSCDYHGIPNRVKNNFEAANFVLMLYFGVESALKFLGLGPRAFWRDKFNRFDLITFMMGLIEAGINPPTFVDGNPVSGKFWTAFRAARIFKIARSWKSLNVFMSALYNSFDEIFNFLLFLVLFILIFSLVGMELFATHYQFDPVNFAVPFNNTNNATRLHRSNFDSITAAAVTVFQYLTYDNWPDVMFDGWISVGVAAPIYASLVIVLGVFVVMNMFSAILVQCVMDADGGGSSSADAAPMPMVTSSFSPDETFARSATTHRDSLRSQSVRAARRAMQQLLRFQSLAAAASTRIQSASLPRQGGTLGQRSLGFFSRTTRLRRLATWLLARREFDWAMGLVIFVSCVFTAVDTPLLDPTTGLGLVLDRSDLVFAILFSLECGINIVARGVVFGRHAYLRDAWRCLDCFIVVVSVLPYCLGTSGGGGALSGLRSLRALRALRPLRVINKLPSLKIVVNTLFLCMADVVRALLFFGFMLFLFGLMGLALWKGAVYTCSISPYTYGQGTGTPLAPPWFPTDYTGDFNLVSLDELKYWDRMTFPRSWNAMRPAERAAFRGVWNQTSGCGPPFRNDDVVPTSKQICLCFASTNGTTWVPQTPQVFDNIFVAVGGLYELTTMEGWTATMRATIDAVGEDMQGVANTTPGYMFWWWAFELICGFFMINLFIGVLCDVFMKQSYGAMLSDEQVNWIKLQNKVLTMSPQRMLRRPAHPVRSFFYTITTFAYCEHILTLVILINTMVMAMDVFGQDESTTLGLNATNTVCSYIFVFEAVVKLVSFGRYYFESNWNRFDFFIVLVTIMNLVLNAYNIDGGPAATVIRVFRVGRALRLIRKAKIMKNLVDTLIVSLPTFGNVASLLSLLYYIFAAVAVQLFAKVGLDNQMINSNQNFQSFWVAYQMLIGWSTGENWDNFTWEVYSTTPSTNPTCVDRPFNASMCGFNNSEGCVPLDGCGSWLIVPFMYTFYMTIGYIAINLFSAIVVDAVGDYASDGPVNVNSLADFADRWAEFDPSGSGLITADALVEFLYTVAPPFGFRGVVGFTRRRVVLAIGELNIPIYDHQYVHFKDVPRALVQRVLAEGDRAKLERISGVMEDYGINKQFDEMWFRTHGRKHRESLSSRIQMPSRRYAAAVIIQGFVARMHLAREGKVARMVTRRLTVEMPPEASQEAQANAAKVMPRKKTRTVLEPLPTQTL